jgi:hypothetical protein
MSTSHPASDVSTCFARQAREQYRLLKIGVLAMLALSCAIPFSLNLVDPDLWGHVQYAQDWLAAGQLPRTATHTYTAVDYPWVNHETGAELAFALGYEHLGIYWMLVLKCLLGMAIMAAMWRTAARHGVGAIAAWALLVLFAANLQAFFPLRPQLFSFALCTLALICLDRAFTAWRAGSSPTPANTSSPTPANTSSPTPPNTSSPTPAPDPREINFRWLWPLPVIFAAWVNCHGGFVAGLAIVGVYLLGRMIELIVACRSDIRRNTRAHSAAQRNATGLKQILLPLTLLAATGLACLAATVVNPYGLGMHRWLWHSWAGAPPEITEWAPPLPGKPVFWPFVTLLVVAVASLAATRRRRDWTQIVILALVAWQACEHLRHIAFVALLCGFWLPVHWQSALMRLRPNADRRLSIVLPPRWFRLSRAAAMLAAMTLQTVALSRRLSDFPVLRSQYPVDALQYMTDHRLGGKLVVAFNWAQDAIAALAPDVQVQFDGRFDTCYPQEVIDMHFDFLLGACTGPRDRSPASGPLDGTRVLDHLHPDLVLVERRYPNPNIVMKQATAGDHPEWSLLYSDAVAELWGRASRYDDPTSAHYLPPAERRFDVKLLEARFQWPALPDRSLADQLSAAVPPAPPIKSLATAPSPTP